MTEAIRPKAQPQPTSAVAVLIVGAGPTGLTLACELARSGISYRVVTFRSRLHVQPRILGVVQSASER